VSEFVFGTHNAAFVQVMYEQYLRDPASVGEEWRNLFDNGRLADLPVIPTSRDDVLRETGGGRRETVGVTPRKPFGMREARCGMRPASRPRHHRIPHLPSCLPASPRSLGRQLAWFRT